MPTQSRYPDTQGTMQPLKYHGGKGMLAKHIHALLNTITPRPRQYIEPYAGGLAVLLSADPPFASLIVNDIDGDVSNFWTVLQHPTLFWQFQQRVAATPFSEVEFARAALPQSNIVERAVAFFVRCRMSMGGRGKSFAPPTRNRLRRGMNESVSSWLSAVDGLPEVHERLRRVMVLNHEATNVIREWDTTDTLHYCDPPYLAETRTSKDVYRHEMTLLDHMRLLNTLATVKGKFILSGYPSAVYDAVARSNRWSCTNIVTANHSASGESKRVMTECLWHNF